MNVIVFLGGNVVQQSTPTWIRIPQDISPIGVTNFKHAHWCGDRSTGQFDAGPKSMKPWSCVEVVQVE